MIRIPVLVADLLIGCAITVSAVTVRCWIAQTSLVSLLGTTVSPFSTSTGGTVVQAVAIPSS